MKSLLALFYFFVISSCLQIKVSKENTFPREKDSLLAQYGAPILKEMNNEGYELFHYQGGISFQTYEQIVISKQVAPQGIENNLSYWKEKFRPYESNLREISGEVRRDGIAFKQEIKCERLGIKLDYSPSQNKVIKVIYLNKDFHK